MTVNEPGVENKSRPPTPSVTSFDGSGTAATKPRESLNDKERKRLAEAVQDLERIVICGLDGSSRAKILDSLVTSIPQKSSVVVLEDRAVSGETFAKSALPEDSVVITYH